MTDLPDPRTLRDALGRFVTGVTVVTTRAAGGDPVGLTANSFTSVSLDPPLVLWSLSARSASLVAFRDAGHFAVNILSEQQRDLSDRFASRTEDRFAGTGWHPGFGGAPLLPGCLARFECSTVSAETVGDHVVFIGRVEGVFHRTGQPLAFFASRYAALMDETALCPAA